MFGNPEGPRNEEDCEGMCPICSGALVKELKVGIKEAALRTHIVSIFNADACVELDDAFPKALLRNLDIFESQKAPPVYQVEFLVLSMLAVGLFETSFRIEPTGKKDAKEKSYIQIVIESDGTRATDNQSRWDKLPRD